LGSVLVQAVAAVLLCTLVPLALFMPPWAVIKAFRRHVDVPGCRATCAKHALEFESYSSTKTEDLCLCHVPDNPRRWQVFKQSYYIFGGDSSGAAVLDAVVRGAAVVGLFLLELVVSLFALFALIHWRRRRLARAK
jgi:ABC-type dipeptide/oligopeptide/nickel transport system permease subunit